MTPNRLDRNKPSLNASTAPRKASRRVAVWFGCLVAILAIFIIRLFYLQIIQHDFYLEQARSDQQKESVIKADRGMILANSGGSLVPMVLNQKRHTLFADPQLIVDPHAAARKIVAVIGGKNSTYAKKMATKNSRYQVLASRLTDKQKNKLLALKIAGLGFQAADYRVYPQGNLGAQLLGFVNQDGQGAYGVEQSLNKELAGQDGRLKAVTDINGIPLAASPENTEVVPRPGSDVVLTIDISMQKQLENILRSGLSAARSSSGSALIIDPHNGRVKAMANWPSYDPAKYFKVSDAAIFNNANVSAPLEVGSVMKVLTAAAALDQKVVRPNTTYEDPGRWELDSHTVTNVAEAGGPGRRSIRDILNLSLNTGATWLLMQMGGGEINERARDRWHEYMVDRYQFGKPTGIEQGYESGGTVPDPRKGSALNLAYANTTFGQAMTATPLQMGAALSAVINGGHYYKPLLVERIKQPEAKDIVNKPKVIRRAVVSKTVSRQIRGMMEYVVDNHIFSPALPKNYSIGGKTGTPQIANPAGGYYEDRFNGTYIGFVGGDRPEYVIVIRVNEPKVGLYAGSGAAQPIFGSVARMLIENFGVPPRD